MCGGVQIIINSGVVDVKISLPKVLLVVFCFLVNFLPTRRFEK